MRNCLYVGLAIDTGYFKIGISEAHGNSCRRDVHLERKAEDWLPCKEIDRSKSCFVMRDFDAISVLLNL